MIATITKYIWEEFIISGDFRKAPAASGEEIDEEASSISAVDKNGVDASLIILEADTKVGSGTRLSVKCKGGDVSKSPYRIDFKMVTSLENKYQARMELLIEE